MRLIIAVAFALLTTSGAWAQPRQVSVIAATVETSTLSDRYEALASVLANESVVISSRVNEAVERILFAEGDKVDQGEVLVELSHAQEQAEWQMALAVLKEKRSNLARVRELFDQGLTSQAELDIAEAEMQGAQADAQARRAELDDRIIRAPFAGVLGMREVSPGAYLTAGQRITSLQDLSRLKLEFTVPQDWVADLREGIALIARQPGAADGVTARLQARDMALDAATRSLRLRAVLDAPPADALPGSLMLVELRSRPREALLVPEAALIPGPKTQRVFRIDNGAVQLQPVVIGWRGDGKVEIVEGLSAGQQVVVHGGDKLRPGSAISVLATYDGRIPIAELIRQQEQAR